MFPILLAHILRIHFVTHARPCHFKSLSSEFDSEADPVNIQDHSRTLPPRRTIRAYRFEEKGRIPNLDISALKRLFASQQAPQFSIRNLLQARLLRHHTQPPLLGELARNRCVLGEVRIFTPILPATHVGGIRTQYHAVRGIASMARRRVQTILDLADDRPTRQPVISFPFRCPRGDW